MPPSRRPPPGTLTLRVGSHNVRNLSTNADVALPLWSRELYLDVVAVQEVKLEEATLLQYQQQLHEVGYDAIWNSNSALSAGVAILYKRSLVTAGRLVVHNEHILTAQPAGLPHRVLAVPMDWGGHQLLVVNVYVPNSHQATFLSDVLPSIKAAHPARHVILLGDFNFVPDPRMDRARASDVAAQADHPTPGDASGPRALEVAWPGLIDVFRAAHPTRRSFTFIGPYGQARLDRIYISPSLQPYTHRCWVGTTTTSDHRPIAMSLTTSIMHGESLGQGVQRIRMRFWGVRALQQEFVEWATTQAEQAPEAAAALIAWWGPFKIRLRNFALQLDRRAAHESRTAAWTTAQRAKADLAAAYAAADQGEQGALELITTRQAAWLRAERAARREARAALSTPPTWLHANERPAPFLTNLVRPPKSRTNIPVLQGADGRLHRPGREQAEVMAAHYAAVSSCPTQPTPEASAAVLAAVRQGKTLSEDAAEVIGDGGVEEGAVLHALRHSKPGKAPGLDGIPVELYRRCRQLFAPLLARLYSAMGETGTLPAGFLDGVITCLPKGGDGTQPANYRPITLLNTDYRVLAKILANRLLMHLDPIISPSQSAFLKGRNIGNNIHLLQLLPYALSASGSTGWVVFLDIAKAYDTVHRGFLRQVMLSMGVGEAFVRWVDLLLTSTCARAVVNGHVSSLHMFTAGVRQGCPLAPLLYLFVGEALYRFLDSQGVGFTVPNTNIELVASQFADDTHAFIPQLADLPALVATLDTFKQASGQGINWGKSKLLPVGRSPVGGLQTLPASAQGIPIVRSVVALGVTFHACLADATPRQPWEELVTAVEETYTRIRRLPLSSFGRAFTAASYGISRVLYAAEFVGLPDQTLVDRLQRATAAVVDQGRGRFHGVRRDLLPGHPSKGGFGALPWVQHIKARHALWALRLLFHDGTHPWVQLGRILLSKWFGPGHHPLIHLMGNGFEKWGSPSRPPEPLTRLISALASLPPVTRTIQQSLPEGEWRASIPLYWNPLLARVGLHGQLDPTLPLDQLHLIRAGARTPGQLHYLQWACVFSHQDPAYQQFLRNHRGGRALAGPAALRNLKAALPAELFPPHGNMQFDNAPGVYDAAVKIAQHLGWVVPGRGMISLHRLTVATATALQLGEATALRIERHQDFACRALGAVQGVNVPAWALQHLSTALTRLWKVKWSNYHKEIYWRLVLNGLPTTERLHQAQEACPCGQLCPGREHHFWDCPAAQAIVQELTSCLPSHTVLQRKHVWLMHPPHGEVRPDVWRVVCLAALKSMWVARGCLMLPAERMPEEQLVSRAKECAVEAFWRYLKEFTYLGRCPQGWRRLLRPDSPFLCYAHPAGHLRINRPPVQPPPQQQQQPHGQPHQPQQPIQHAMEVDQEQPA